MGANFSDLDNDQSNEDVNKFETDEESTVTQAQKKFTIALSQKLCRDIIVYEIIHPFVYVDTKKQHQIADFFGYFKKDKARKVYLLYTNFGNVKNIKSIPSPQTRMIRNLRFTFTCSVFDKMCTRFESLNYLSLTLDGFMTSEVLRGLNKLNALRTLRLYIGKPVRENKLRRGYGDNFYDHKNVDGQLNLPELRNLFVFGFNETLRYLNDVVKNSKMLTKLMLSPFIPPDTPNSTKDKFPRELLNSICRCETLMGFTLYYFEVEMEDVMIMVGTAGWKEECVVHLDFHGHIDRKFVINGLERLKEKYPNTTFKSANYHNGWLL